MPEPSKKNILITGATGGIGKAISHQLSAKNNILILVSKNKEKLAKLKLQIPSSAIFPADFNKPKSIELICHKISKLYSKLDILINNAAVFETGRLENLNEENYFRSFMVNVTAPFLMIKYLLPLLKKSDAGHIINISSISAHHAWAEGSAYCASKFALTGMSESLREEIKPMGIRLSVVSPGQTDTTMSLAGKKDPLRKKMLSAEEVSKLVAYTVALPKTAYFPEVILRPLI